MLTEYPPDMPWAIVRLMNQFFAVPTQDLREMVIMPPVSRIPNTPNHIRGAINLRGQVLPVVDLRKLIGWSSTQDETDAFCSLMQQREQDHRNWLNELESCVKERREFKLTTNPHACAFGKWYDSYHPENPWIAKHLRKFDPPHQRIHMIGAEVQKLAAEGEYRQAQDSIDRARNNILSQMLQLFSELRTLIRETQAETAMILTNSGKTFAASIDEAISVERLVAGSIEGIPTLDTAEHNGLVRRLGKRTKGEEVVMIIEPNLLF